MYIVLNTRTKIPVYLNLMAKINILQYKMSGGGRSGRFYVPLKAVPGANYFL